MNNNTYDQIRDEILNQLILLMGIVCVPVAAFSVFRYLQMGWRNVFFVHILIVPFTFYVVAKRKSISYNEKVGFILGVFYLVSILAFVNFPISGQGLEFLMLFVLVTVVFLSRRMTLVVVLISITTIAVVGFLSINGVIDPRVDSAVLSTFYSGWTNSFVSFSLLMLAVVFMVGNIVQILNLKIVELNRINEELQSASEEIRTLQGIVPICSSCKSIRDDEGYWHRVEIYVRDHTNAEFSHGICPDCYAKLYPPQSQDHSRQEHSGDSES